MVQAMFLNLMICNGNNIWIKSLLKEMWLLKFLHGTQTLKPTITTMTLWRSASKLQAVMPQAQSKKESMIFSKILFMLKMDQHISLEMIPMITLFSSLIL